MSLSKTKSNREQILSHAALLSGSGMIGYLFQFVTGIVNPKVLGPQQYGAWQIVGLITGYAGYSHLGIAQALRREIPMALGRNDEDRAAYLRDVGYSTTMLLSAVFVGAISLMYLVGINFKGVLTLPLLILVVFNVLVARYGTAYSNVLTGYGKFTSLSYFDAAMPALFMVLSIPLVILFKVPGLVIANTLSQLIAFLITRSHAKVPVRRRFDRAGTWHLLKVGFPIMMLLFVQRIFQSLELTLAALFLPVAEVGVYGLALGMLAAADLIPASFNKLFLREMARDYGQGEEGDYGSFRKYMQMPCVGYVFITLIAGQSFFFAFSVLVGTLLGAYTTAIRPMAWLVVGYVFFNMRMFSSLFFTLVRRNKQYLSILVGSLILNMALDTAVLASGYGLATLAAASSLSYVVFGGVTIIACDKHVFGSWSVGVKQFARFVVALTISFGVLHLLSNVMLINIFPNSGMTRFIFQVFDGIIKIAALAGLNILIFSLAFRDIHFRSEMWRNVKTVGYQLKDRVTRASATSARLTETS